MSKKIQINDVTPPKVSKVKKINVTKVLCIAQAVVIALAIAGGIGFFVGKNYANKQANTVHAQAVALTASLK